jgi:hypothetical protein
MRSRHTAAGRPECRGSPSTSVRSFPRSRARPQRQRSHRPNGGRGSNGRKSGAAATPPDLTMLGNVRPRHTEIQNVFPQVVTFRAILPAQSSEIRSSGLVVNSQDALTSKTLTARSNRIGSLAHLIFTSGCARSSADQCDCGRQRNWRSKHLASPTVATYTFRRRKRQGCRMAPASTRVRRAVKPPVSRVAPGTGRRLAHQREADTGA